jgi:hypothetical protein
MESCCEASLPEDRRKYKRGKTRALRQVQRCADGQLVIARWLHSNLMLRCSCHVHFPRFFSDIDTATEAGRLHYHVTFQFFNKFIIHMGSHALRTCSVNHTQKVEDTCT